MAVLNPAKKGNGYAVLEVNKLESRTTGNMVANAPLATNFTCKGINTADGTQTFAENGMILYHDATSDKGNRYGAIVGTPTDASVPGLVWATEHIYDDYNKQLSNFKMDRPMDPTEEATPYNAPYGQQKHYQFYPRLYVLGPTDTFTTDAIDLGTFTYLTIADATAASATASTSNCVEKALASGIVYVNYPANGGYSVLAGSKGDSTYGVVEKITTLPNGFDPAIKVRVIK